MRPTSSKQSEVALSTYEAEYLAGATAVQQTNWIRRILNQTPYAQPEHSPLFTENESAIKIGRNSAPTKRRKLIDVRHHRLQDNVTRGVVTLHRVPTSDNPANMLNKPLGKTKFKRFTTMLNITEPAPQS